MKEDRVQIKVSLGKQQYDKICEIQRVLQNLRVKVDQHTITDDHIYIDNGVRLANNTLTKEQLLEEVYYLLNRYEELDLY